MARVGDGPSNLGRNVVQNDGVAPDVQNKTGPAAPLQGQKIVAHVAQNVTAAKAAVVGAVNGLSKAALLSATSAATFMAVAGEGEKGAKSVEPGAKAASAQAVTAKPVTMGTPNPKLVAAMLKKAESECAKINVNDGTPSAKTSTAALKAASAHAATALAAYEELKKSGQIEVSPVADARWGDLRINAGYIDAELAVRQYNLK